MLGRYFRASAEVIRLTLSWICSALRLSATAGARAMAWGSGCTWLSAVTVTLPRTTGPGSVFWSALRVLGAGVSACTGRAAGNSTRLLARAESRAWFRFDRRPAGERAAGRFNAQRARCWRVMGIG